MQRSCALRERQGCGYNCNGHSQHPTVWLGWLTGDPGSFDRMEQRDESLPKFTEEKEERRRE
jgi:hypothetical protein